MASTQGQAQDTSPRNSVADVEADAKTLNINGAGAGDGEKAPARKAKPGEAWKADEVHKIPHK